jgi:hypothetical protein
MIYQIWLEHGQKILLTAKAIGKRPEEIRKTVARVKRKLSLGEIPPGINDDY